MSLERDPILEAVDRLEADARWKRTGVGDRRKILDEVFDERTLKALHKLMNEGRLQTLDFPIATGKEASLFVGLTKKADEVAVKIYRVGNATFNSIRRYIADDPRFRVVRHDRRSVIYAWAMKEYKNLLRLKEAGVSVPEPITHFENILLMEYLFVGDNHDPAPPMRQVREFDADKVFRALKRDVRRMVKDGHLVHGDLSEYNVLLVGSRPYLIDVSQGVVLDHPQSREYLRRDAENLARYFGKKGVDTAAAELFEYWARGVKFGGTWPRGAKGREEE